MISMRFSIADICLKYISPTLYERQLISVLQPLPSIKTVHLLSRYTPSYVKPVIDSVFYNSNL